MMSLFQSREKGNVTVLVALGMVAMVGFCALAVDIGVVYIELQKLQNAIDAAALAAAQDLPNTTSATYTAYDYVQANGFEPADIQINFTDSNKTIEITSSHTVDYFFAPALGYDSVTIHPAASASIGSMGGPFDYVLFSGSEYSTLTLNGSSQMVEGSSHTNKNFVANGSKITITGACEAVTTVTVNGSNISIGSREPGADYVEMPDFSDALKAQAEAAGTAYTGNKTYNSSKLSVDSPIYVDGDVTINGSNFSGRGCILATGDITFNGSNLNETTSDAVCFYSQDGDITINGSNAELDGIVYAPNGSITMNGSNQTIHGRVIGYTVTINGSKLSIIGGSGELNALPNSGVRLTK